MADIIHGKGKVELEKSYGERELLKVSHWILDEEKTMEMSLRDLKLEKSDEEERDWMNLPTDIISQILSGLPMESLIRCMFLCKSWYALTKDPCFIELQLSKAMCQPRFILSGYMGSWGLFSIDNRGRDKWKATRILKEIHGRGLKIEGSCNGLLCVASYSYYGNINIFICNPITRECIRLPKSKLLPKLSFNFWLNRSKGELGFGFDAICNKYKVARLHLIETPNGRICVGEVITLGQSSWREIKIPHTGLLFEFERVVFLDGALHWLITDKTGAPQILVFDMRNEKFQIIMIPSPMAVNFNPHLIKFEESLAIVMIQILDPLMHIWKIVGNDCKGYLLDKCYYDIPTMKGCYEIFSGKLVVMLNDDSFLLHVKRRMGYPSDEVVNLLLLYFPAKKKYFHVRISGIRGWHGVVSFVPSLVSPRAAAAAANGRSQKGTLIMSSL